MDTKKRRVIWMDDENWDRLGRVVDREQTKTHALGLTQKITRSLVILDALDRGYFRVLREAEGTVRYDTQPVRAVPKVKK